MLSGYPNANVVTAIWPLVDFRYLAQAPVISSTTRDKIAAALAMFHQHKQSILNHGLCRGAQTNAPLDHFNIPKLELMHNIVLSISNVGSILQWTADTTEHAHIEVIKEPAAMTNNMNYNAQICRTLDRNEKCCLFNVAISLTQQARRMAGGSDRDLKDETDDRDDDGDGNLGLADELWSPHRKETDLLQQLSDSLLPLLVPILVPFESLSPAQLLSISIVSPQSATSPSMTLHRSSTSPTCEGP
jgi:hypothetical protein